RPAILPLLAQGRRERLDRFIRSIGPGRPTFYLKHVLLPHGPYMFLPSGRQTRRTFQDPVPGMNSPRGFGDRFLTDHNQQRFLLQIAYVDRELGRMFTRMRENGTFDTSLIAITADHGMAFEVGVRDRRTATPANIDEIAPVPMFIKAPGQRRGRTDRSYMRTIDLVPTIADVLNIRMPYRADGRSAFSHTIRGRRFVRMIKRGFDGTLTISARSFEARRRALVRRKLRLYGSGDFRSLYTGIGPNRFLIGRRAATLGPAGLGRVRAGIVDAADMRLVGPASLIHPTQVAGPISGGRRGAKRDLAVAVNGTIEAVGRSFYLRGSSQESYAMMVPEPAMRPGRNSVEVFEVSNRGRSLRLIGHN
ncbi:MAG: sulfatase-like hydrolase/transferase, partial [Actinomycetota bacterium]|nr:sulfatase-like hydrolase/transferase [Actinomycetota bacterium]